MQVGLNLKQKLKELVLQQKGSLRHEYLETIFSGIDSVRKNAAIANRFDLDLVTRTRAFHVAF